MSAGLSRRFARRLSKAYGSYGGYEANGANGGYGNQEALISLLIVGAEPRATTLRFRRLREDLGNGAVRFFSYGSISAFGVSGFFSNFGDWELF